MLVYGDQEETRCTYAVVEALLQKRDGLAERAAGILWHQECVALFIAVSGLAQGVVDSEFAARGFDSLSFNQARLLASLRELARILSSSWSSSFAQQELPLLASLEELDNQSLPRKITIRRCEGYAYYALYPEQYLVAAHALPKKVSVIGLRSIGIGLAALVASECRASFLCTLRPVGDAYSRTVMVAPELEEKLLTRRDGIFVVVDEGPGQSGSSMGGVADYLEQLGVKRSRIIFMPSHGGDLGPNAQIVHRRRWESATRLSIDFERLFFNDEVSPSFTSWFADLTGPALSSPRDISAGKWRSASRQIDASVDPGREARKFLLQAERGTFLLKFIGLDDMASAKLNHAQRLHVAGFTPEPIGLRYGFLVERWVDGAPLTAETDIWPLLKDYIGWRASNLPANKLGAPLTTLASMARFNLERAFGAGAGKLFDAWPHEQVAALQSYVQPVHVDGRLHLWEWVKIGVNTVKTDAIDHAEAHDLVGNQDVAWDVAGALVEFSASKQQRDEMIEAVFCGRTGGRELTALMTLCYLGFQVGWWDFSQDRKSADRQRRFYGRAIMRLLAEKRR